MSRAKMYKSKASVVAFDMWKMISSNRSGNVGKIKTKKNYEKSK